MELFAPENLPGVGMGDLESIAAICGLLGLAATSGVLLAEGVVGTMVFIVAALLVLREKPDFGGSVPAASAVLALLALIVATRMLLEFRTRAAEAELKGAASDAPETRTAQALIARRERWSRRLAIIAVIWAGGSVGFAWAEWNEVPFRFEDLEAFLGFALGLVAAGVGGDAAWRFLHGAVRAGGSAAIIGVVVTLVALLLNALSVYVPFVGAAVFLLTLALAVRLRRRQQQKYAGLRILS